ncbi:MAG TPA: alginate lyase family protein [Lacunisphaera sp.]|nr:alginate lyase family protein [Lacunisphaera sp.]
MKSLALLACLLLFLPTAAEAAKPFLVDPAALLGAAPERTIRSALAAPIVNITQQAQPSPSGDPHDYISYGRYWWPDPAEPDGLPYIQRDGHPNAAQIAQGDERLLGAMLKNTAILAAGWTVEHREDCARRAAEWLRTWFATPATRITPSFAYAQIRPGRDHNRGTASGLIDTRGFAGLVDTLCLLEDAPGMDAALAASVRDWVAAYLDWLTTSPNGRKEQAARNNHGSWYLVQAVALARYLGHDEQARILAREDFGRIDWQIEPDGRQPLEISRTDGLSYSRFNLEAQLKLARLAAPLGVDLWHYESPRGGSLRRALDYLKPFDVAPGTWPHKQLAPVKAGFLQPLLDEAARLDHPAPQG